MDTFFDYFFLLLITLTMLYGCGLIYLGMGLKRCKADSVRHEPFVSIIVSMHNEEKNARACLDRLTGQLYPASAFEILIIDDRSTDQTAGILADYAKKHAQVRLLTIKEAPGDFAPKKYAISQAIERAAGEIILLTDADGRPPAFWIRQMVSLFDKNTGMVIGYAPYITDPPYQNLIYRLLSLEYLSHAAIAAATTCLAYPLTCVGTNMAYRKQVFEQLGGYGKYKSVHTGDDDLFLQRVREETDWKIRYCSDAEGQVWNAPPQTWRKFFHQRLRYGSKGFLYPPRVTRLLILFYILNLLFFLAPCSLIYNYAYSLPLFLIFFLKGGSEFSFLSRAAGFIKDKRHVGLFPIAFLFHIPYVLIFGLLSQFISYQWANRKSR